MQKLDSIKKIAGLIKSNLMNDVNGRIPFDNTPAGTSNETLRGLAEDIVKKFEKHFDKNRFLIECGFKKNTITCPLCNGTAEYRKLGETHVWACEEDCPFVGFEYYDDEDIDSLSKHF
jgi:hypothetical protein